MNNKLKYSLIGILCVVALSGSAFIGYRIGHAKSVVVLDSKSLISSDFSLFWEAVDMVKSKHVDAKGIEDKKLLYGAVKGMLSAYDDPYTAFFNPSDAKKFDQDLSGNFGGIGAQIGIRNEALIVVAPLKGSPAEKAGLRALDKIWKINSKDTSNLDVDEAVKLIRGDVGTEVTLSIYREGWHAAKDFKITRDTIQVPTIASEIKTTKSGKKIAVVSLYNFNANVPGLFKNEMEKLLPQKFDGIVFDLRNNPGGFLDVAVNLAGWFVKKGDVVVTEKYRVGDDTVLKADGNELLHNYPVVVLVNEGSASASEIVAGALRDDIGAKLVGAKSFGKGSVQELETLSDGSTMKVTIAHWFTPKGTKIDKVGLKPDTEVTISDEDYNKNKDPQLEKALELAGAEAVAKKK